MLSRNACALCNFLFPLQQKALEGAGVIVGSAAMQYQVELSCLFAPSHIVEHRLMSSVHRCAGVSVLTGWQVLGLRL